jgi:hypothetical protein
MTAVREFHLGSILSVITDGTILFYYDSLQVTLLIAKEILL